MKSLQLHIPELKKPEKTSFKTDQNHLTDWISKLPMANLGEASKALYRSLIAVNRLNIPDNERLKYLELIEEPVQFCIAGLQRRFIGIPFPFSQKNNRIAKICQDFSLQMATGYKILAINTPLSTLHKKKCLHAIYQSLFHSGQTLIHSYEAYSRPSQYLWQDMHQLFYYAETHNLLNKYVTGKSGNIIILYKKILIFSIVSPGQIPQEEISKLYDSLAEFTHLCDVSYFHKEVDSLYGQFFINLKQDNHPKRLIMHEKSDANDNRLLDCSNALNTLSSAIKNLDENNERLLNRQLNWLMQSWGPMIKHSQIRQPLDIETSVSLSLNNTADFVKGYQGGIGQLKKEDIKPENGTTNSALHQPTETVRCRCINYSQGGYCLVWPTEQVEKIRIGTLIGVLSKKHNQPVIGMIRWIRNMANQTLIIGIETIATQAISVLATDTESTQTTHALLLPERSEMQRSSAILLPSKPFLTDAIVEINNDLNVDKILLDKEIYSSTSFSIFNYSPYQPKSKETKKQYKNPIDAIWDDL